MKAKRIFDNTFGLYSDYLTYLTVCFLSFCLAVVRPFMGQREEVSFLVFISIVTVYLLLACLMLWMMSALYVYKWRNQPGIVAQIM